MSLRVCAEPGCPTLVNRTRCRRHERARDQARGSRQDRGYDRQHELERAAWAPIVASGSCRCRRCRELIGPDEPWDLGHPDTDCDRPKAPEHQRCNRATSGRIVTPRER